jgi:hypothetical protein
LTRNRLVSKTFIETPSGSPALLPTEQSSD